MPLSSDTNGILLSLSLSFALNDTLTTLISSEYNIKQKELYLSQNYCMQHVHPLTSTRIQCLIIQIFRNKFVNYFIYF